MVLDYKHTNTHTHTTINASTRNSNWLLEHLPFEQPNNFEKRLVMAFFERPTSCGTKNAAKIRKHLKIA